MSKFNTNHDDFNSGTKLTRKLLRQIFNYDHGHGVLTWREPLKKHYPDIKAWTIACTRKKSQPLVVSPTRLHRPSVALFGATRSVAKLVWIWCYDTDPNRIKHKDENVFNLRIKNLIQANDRRCEILTKKQRKKYKELMKLNPSKADEYLIKHSWREYKIEETQDLIFNKKNGVCWLVVGLVGTEQRPIELYRRLTKHEASIVANCWLAADANRQYQPELEDFRKGVPIPIEGTNYNFRVDNYYTRELKRDLTKKAFKKSF